MPDASIADLPAQIALALSIASSSTGADYHYLVNTARTESSFQADAKAPTSSAEGLFQFIEETWIRTIKDLGAPYGLGKYADMITKTPAGRYNVDTSEHRAAILKLRKDPMVSAKMAAAYARQNEDFVRNAIGRTPTSDGADPTRGRAAARSRRRRSRWTPRTRRPRRAGRRRPRGGTRGH